MSPRVALLAQLRATQRSTRWLRRLALALLVVDVAGLVVALTVRQGWEFIG